jgi:hypothetical protein
MTEARYHCCNLQRRNAVAAHATLNGLEALEVIDRDLESTDPLRQRTLLLFFLKPIATAGLGRDNVIVSGGERIRDPAVEWVAVASSLPAPPPPPPPPAKPTTEQVIAALPNKDHVLVVRVAGAGDYSRYEARLQGVSPAAFDARLSNVEFSFKAECPSEFDCRDVHTCPPAERDPPEIDYLARDFGTFRRLMLDRMAQQVPDWNPASVADGGVALIELLAYVGDQLAYRQDAIATESYLGTARRRISARRHAQLVDYRMHDGCNARTFVHLTLRNTAPSLVVPRSGTQFLTRCDRVDAHLTKPSPQLTEALLQRPLVFEPMTDVTLYSDHNELQFHTWSDEQCCLPVGATRATLRNLHPNLKPGDYLLFEEVRGPRTGEAADADPTHRQVVRLTGKRDGSDAVLAIDVTEIEWAPEDALIFPLCISAALENEDGTEAFFSDVSVARGNLVLADHGATRAPESLPVVPAGRTLTLASAGGHCDGGAEREIPARYRPLLRAGPVTQAPPLADGSARAALQFSAADALPQVTSLTGVLNSQTTSWELQRSLLDSKASDTDFVVEAESDGRARLRFGDGRYGLRPDEDTAFTAIYRIGNGTVGNIGADALAHVAGIDVSLIDGVRNPLPADGGAEPESVESVRRRAPEAFRRQERAVTPADYVEVTERLDGVQHAASRLRWTGSWHTMFVTVDRTGGAPIDADLRERLARHVDRFRMAGQDVDLEEPERVSLELALHVCVAPDYFRSDVKEALQDLFGAGLRRDGQRGLFHADNFSFGTTVYLSPLIAAAHAVPGVASVSATIFGRQGSDDTTALEDGRLALGPREIARLDNDPNFPEHGVLTLELHGGK